MFILYLIQTYYHSYQFKMSYLELRCSLFKFIEFKYVLYHIKTSLLSRFTIRKYHKAYYSQQKSTLSFISPQKLSHVS